MEEGRPRIGTAFRDRSRPGQMDEQITRKTKGIAAVERALRVLDAFLSEESPMDAGRVLEVAAPAQFFSAPRHARARQFLAEILPYG